MIQFLIDVLTLIAFIYLFLLITWICFLAVMNLKRNLSKITPIVKLFAYPAVGIGLLWDGAFNIIVGTLLFLELPQELLFTSRCERHMKEQNWRGREARFWCRNFLDPFDPDHPHCR